MSKTAFVFPGQGSQHIGMGNAICEESSAAKDTFNEASDVLGYDVFNFCKCGKVSEFNKMEVIFPTILTVGVASYRAICQQMNVQVDFLAGHSFGEYTALACSGAVQFSDMLKVVYKRGQIAQRVADKETGYMSIIDNIPITWVQEICNQLQREGHTVSISAYNSQTQVAICGNSVDVEFAENELIKKDATITPLIFSPPFHCALMQEIVDELRDILKKIEYHPFSIPVISNIDAMPYPSENDIVEYLCRQIVQPVQWTQTLDFFARTQVSKIFDMGPQAILTNIIKQYNPIMSVYSIAKKEERDALRRTVPSRGRYSDIKGQGICNIVTRCMAMAVSTCNYNTDVTEYQSGVMQPYEQLEALAEDIEKSNVMQTERYIYESFYNLHKIFESKHVPVCERLRRFDILLSELNFEESTVGREFIHNLYEENSDLSFFGEEVSK